MTDDAPIELEPDDNPPGKARIDAKGLLHDFDPDADFDHDPQVQEALGKAPARPDRAADAQLADPTQWMLSPGWPSARVCLIAAAVISLGAVVASIVRVDQPGFWIHFWAGVRTAYSIAVMTGIGLLAVVASAHFSERGFNLPELALARLAPPVALAHLIAALPLFFPSRTDELILACAAYLLMLFVTFRLPRFETMLIAGAHFGLWMVLRIGLELARLTQPG